MSRDRTRDRTANPDAPDVEFDIDAERRPDADTGNADEKQNALRTRIGSRAGTLFSPRRFLVALLLTVAGLLVSSTFVPLPGAGLLGIFGAAFLFGLAIDERRYVEAAVAGAIVTAASTLLDVAVVAFLGGFGVSLAALAAGAGALVGTIGTYFGRDLRDGLTRNV